MKAAFEPLEADYVVVGCGAAGMAFADSLIAHSNATVLMIDRRPRPGGHWNDSYPFVRLHLPSYMYGVCSRELGDRSVCREGHSQGLLQMASGAEVVGYYERVMDEVLLASGRVKFLSMSNFEPGGSVTSLLTGGRRTIKARRKVVNATFCESEVPSTHLRPFIVASNVSCVPIGELTCMSRPYREYCVVGAGKTGVDACLWLLRNGVQADEISWVMPRDAWWMDRARLQFTREYFEASVGLIVDQMEALAEANSVDDLFLKFETRGVCLRLDPQIRPTMYHGASATRSEVDALRLIRRVIRKGHVKSITRTHVELQHGVVEMSPDTLYIDCSARGAPSRHPVPIFEGSSITLQWIKSVRPSLSAALIGYIETLFHDDQRKNELCTPVPAPREPVDWLRMLAVSARNQKAWASDARIGKWVEACRLEPTTALLDPTQCNGPGAAALLERCRRATRVGVANIQRLLDSHAPPMQVESSLDSSRQTYHC